MVTLTHTTPGVRLSATPYQEHRSYVLGVLGRRCRWLDPSDREAILHDAYIVFLEKQRSGTLAAGAMRPEQVRAYLTNTALHKALDESKRAWRRMTIPLEPDGAHADIPSTEPGVDAHVVATEDRARVRDLVAQLPERRRRVVGLRYFHDWSPRDVQQHLAITERTYRRELETGTRTLAAALCS